MNKASETPVKFHAHPVMIFRYLKRYLFLLLIPLARALINYGFDVTNTLIVSETALAAAIITISVIKWRRLVLTVSDHRVMLKSGLIVTVITVLERRRVTTVAEQYKPVIWAMGGGWLQIYCAGEKKPPVLVPLSSGKLSLALSALDCPAVSRQKRAEAADGAPGRDRPVMTYHASGSASALYALSQSSAVSGLILVVPALQNAGKLVGESISNQVVDTVNSFALWFEPYIGVTAAMPAIILAVGFITSFIVSNVKNAHINVSRYKDIIEVSAGLIVRTHSFHRMDQNLPAWGIIPPVNQLLRRITVKLDAGRMEIMVPSIRRRRMDEVAKLIPGGNSWLLSNPEHRPARGTRRRYGFIEAVLASVTFLLAAGGVATVPSRFKGLVLLIAGGALTLIAVRFIVMRRAYGFGGISARENGCTVYAAKGLSLCAVNFERENIGLMTISQNPFDRGFSVTSVTVRPRLSGGESLTARNISSSEIDSIINHNM